MTSKNTKGTGFRERRFLLPVEREGKKKKIFVSFVSRLGKPSSLHRTVRPCPTIRNPPPPGLMDALVTQWVAVVKVPTAFRKVVKDLL